jgi:transcription elongation factor GreA
LQLIEIQKSLYKTSNLYFKPLSKERDEFYDLVRKYIQRIEKIVENVNISENADNNFPFVIIGSNVQIIHSQTYEMQTYEIVFPYQEDRLKRKVSYISSLGMELLLKHSGNVITIGKSSPVQYIIGGITLV